MNSLPLPLSLLLALLATTLAPVARAADANRLTYLDEFLDPFYPSLAFPKLTTPQWVGEAGVDAVVILSTDQRLDAGGDESFLRPVLDRLQRIDGRAPLSLFTDVTDPADPRLQRWRAGGISLEAMPAAEPGPLLASSNLLAARRAMDDCIDRLARVAGGRPTAVRLPGSELWNAQSPRFFTEIFNPRTDAGNFPTIDSSIQHLFTRDDPDLPRALILDEEGRERFAKYITGQVPHLGRTNYAYANYIANYPYPYVVGRIAWEFPPAIPGGRLADTYSPAYGRHTVRDWKAALDCTVIKQGVMTLTLRAGSSGLAGEIIEFIDQAVAAHGRRVKFLTFREAQQRLDEHLLAGQPLRAPGGGDNGVRLLDLNHDGYLDVVIGNERLRQTRVWEPGPRRWRTNAFPVALVDPAPAPAAPAPDAGVRFGVVQEDGLPMMIVRNEKLSGAWQFNGTNWIERRSLLRGLTHEGQPILTSRNGRDRGVRLRDPAREGRCELIVGNDTQNAIFAWSRDLEAWKELRHRLPRDTAIVDAEGRDAGLRFADFNGDGLDDLLQSNEDRYSLHLWVKPGVWRAFDQVGWTRPVSRGRRGDPDGIPMIVRGGEHRNNGAWLTRRRLWVQNEDTGDLAGHTVSRSFDDLVRGFMPPALSPEESRRTIHVPPGFTVELVAAEPLVVDPVSMEWGEDGRLWVVEMRDYPLGLDGKGKPGGTIRVLEDRDGDGRYDHSTVFISGLNFPTGVMPWRRGCLISAAPDILYAEDTDGDGVADVRRVLFTGFAQENQQHRLNGFEYGLDNWVYAANSGSGGDLRARPGLQPGTKPAATWFRGLDQWSLLTPETAEPLDLRTSDLRFDPDHGALQPVAGATEFGRHRDDWGNWFGNTYATWGYHFFLPVQYLSRNPFLPGRRTYQNLVEYPNSRRIYRRSRLLARPQTAQPLDQVTSPCSFNPYRDDLFGPEFARTVFISEVDKNIIHREILEPSGVTFTSHRAPGEEQSEFVASTDNWFRPTQSKTGPDGALYVADMYRLIIEHEEYYPADLRELLDFRAGSDKGRIYRIHPTNAPPRRMPRLDRLDTAGLVAALDSPNGWQRDTAQRLLVHRQDPAAVAPLQDLFTRSGNAKARLQALCTLDGLRALTPGILLQALQDPHPAVREHGVRLSEPFLAGHARETPPNSPPNSPPGSPLLDALLAMVADTDLRVRYQLAFTLGESRDERAGTALARLALRDADNEDLQVAVLSSAVPHLRSMFGHLTVPGASPPPEGLLSEWLSLAASLDDPETMARALDFVVQPAPGRPGHWQFNALAEFMGALERRGQSLARLQAGAPAELKRALAGLPQLFTRAGSVAADRDADEDSRVSAIALLDRGPVPTPADRVTLQNLLRPEVAGRLQKAAAENLAEKGDDAAADLLLGAWPGFGPELRAHTLNLLLTRESWIGRLLARVEDGSIPAGQLGAVQRQKLMRHRNETIRAQAGRLLTATNPDRQQVLQRYAGVAELIGDARRGGESFRQYCAVCHRFRGAGAEVGPDLSGLIDKPLSYLLQSILDPSRMVDPEFAAYTLVTRTGQELSGIIAAENANSLTLRLPNLGEQTILRRDVSSLRSSSLSLMPEGFEAALDVQAMADLIAWLKSDESAPPK